MPTAALGLVTATNDTFALTPVHARTVGALGVLPTFIQRSTTGNASGGGTIPAHGSAAAGDLQVLLVAVHTSVGAPTASGFTYLQKVADSTHAGLHILYRVASSGNATSSVAVSWTDNGRAEMRSYRDAVSVSVVGHGTGLVSPSQSVGGGILMRVMDDSGPNSGSVSLTITPDANLLNNSGAVAFNWYQGLTIGDDPVTSGTAPARTAVQTGTGTGYPQYADVLVWGNPADISAAQAMTVLYPGRFSDTFDRTNSTEDLGSPWIQYSGVWGINTNLAYVSNLQQSPSVAYLEAYDTDTTISATLTTILSTGLALRWEEDNRAGYYLEVSAQAAVATLYAVSTPSGNTWQLTSLGITTATFSNGDRLKVVCSGNDFNIYKNDVFDTTITDVSFAGTKFGLGTRSTTSRFDNFYVYRGTTRVISHGGYNQAALALGPALYLKLNEGTADTTAIDYSGYGYNGTYGTSSAKPVPYGSGLIPTETDTGMRFIGNDTLQIPDQSIWDFTSAFTITAVIKPDQWSGTGCIVARDNNSARNFQWQFSSSGKLVWQRVQTPTFAITSTTTMYTQRTYHVAISWDGATYRHYINGVQDATTYNDVTSYSATATPVTVGYTDRSGPTNFFRGVIEKVSFHPGVALSGAQIAALAALVAADGPVGELAGVRALAGQFKASEFDYARRLLRMRGNKVTGAAFDSAYYGGTAVPSYVGDQATMWSDGSDASYAHLPHGTDIVTSYSQYRLRTLLPATNLVPTQLVARAKFTQDQPTDYAYLYVYLRGGSSGYWYQGNNAYFNTTTSFADITITLYPDSSMQAELAAGTLNIYVYAYGTTTSTWSFDVSEAYIYTTEPWAANLAAGGLITETDTVIAPLVPRFSLAPPSEETAEVFPLTVVTPTNGVWAKLDDFTEDGQGTLPLYAITLANTESGEYLGVTPTAFGAGADNWASATAVAINYVGGYGVSAATDNTGFTVETGEDALMADYHSPVSTAWWSYTPTSSGTLTLDTNSSTYVTPNPPLSPDTILAIYTGTSLAGLTRLAYDDDSGTSNMSQLSVAVTNGTTYYIQVGNYGVDDPCNFVLTATGPATVPSAPSATVATLWYSWTAPASSVPSELIVSFDYTGQSANGGGSIRIFGTNVGVLPEVSDLLTSGVQTGSAGTVSATLSTIVANTTYLIQVGLQEKAGTTSGLTVQFGYNQPQYSPSFYTPSIPSL